MTALENPAITLAFNDAITVLMEACGVPLKARVAFEARIRQLQRLGVPRRKPDPAKARLDYGLAELAALATAVRLMAAFMVPTLAARYVVERWQALAPFLLAGGHEALPPSYLAKRPLSHRTLAVFEGNALADMGEKGRHDERYEGPLGRITIVDDLTGVLMAAAGAGVMLDSTSYMATLISRFADAAMATELDLAFELDRLRFAGA